MIELSLELVDGGRGIRLKTRGVVPGAVFIGAHMAMAEERQADLSHCRYWFSDHSRLDARLLDSVDASTVARLGERLMVRLPGLAIANLAGDDLTFGMLRMWEGLAEGSTWVSRTFRDRAEIRPWLSEAAGMDVDPDAAPVGSPIYLFRDEHDVAPGGTSA